MGKLQTIDMLVERMFIIGSNAETLAQPQSNVRLIAALFCLICMHLDM